MKKGRAVVLGGGPCGLTAAWRLAKEDYEVHLLERAERVGGLGASFEHKGFILDYGPHAFHIKKGDIVPIVESFFKNDLLRKNTNIKTLANGRYLKYPFEFYNLLTQLSPFLVVRMIFDFLMASLIYKFIHIPDDNFESWGIKRFGKTLYNFCFGHYTQRVWGAPSRLISSKFAAKKIKALSVKNIITKILGGKGEEHEVYWERYLYPEKGSGELFNRMGEDFVHSGGGLHLNSAAFELAYKDEKISSVKFTENGHERIVDCDLVVSTIPIRDLMLMIRPSFGDYISYTAKRLKYRAIIFVYLVFEKERISDALWIYLLDDRFRFNRVTEQKNLSTKVCPDGKTVLCFEICCNTDDDIWGYSEEKLKIMALEDIRHIQIIDPSQITDCFVRKIDEAYSVCHIDYDKHLKDLLEHLSHLSNLLTAGRQGLYLQNDMHDTMVMGLNAAEFFIGKRKDGLAWYKEQTNSYIDW